MINGTVLPVGLCGSATWSWIRSQLDRSRRYKVHVLNDNGTSICGTRVQDDEQGEMTMNQFLNYDWACKKCLAALWQDE